MDAVITNTMKVIDWVEDGQQWGHQEVYQGPCWLREKQNQTGPEPPKTTLAKFWETLSTFTLDDNFSNLQNQILLDYGGIIIID